MRNIEAQVAWKEYCIVYIIVAPIVASWYCSLMKTTAENPNIRITPRSKGVLRALAKQQGKPMQAVLDEAIERYQRDKFLDEANAAYAKLRSDARGWKAELAERALWDKTLADGLSDK
jgi:hypothetical protein